MLQHQCLFKGKRSQNIVIFEVVHLKTPSPRLSGLIYRETLIPGWVMVSISTTKLVEYLAIR